MKGYFLTGVVILLPLALTFWIIAFIVRILTTPFQGIAHAALSAVGLNDISFLFLSSEQVLNYLSKILVLCFLFMLIVGIGMVGRRFFFNSLMKMGDAVLHRIPVISTVYKTSQELTQTIFASTSKSFKQVVLVPFPHDDSLCMGLVTRDDLEMGTQASVFIPTTPNPTSGLLVIVKKEHITPLDMRVEDALRYIISCGVLPVPIKREGAYPLNGMRSQDIGGSPTQC